MRGRSDASLQEQVVAVPLSGIQDLLLTFFCYTLGFDFAVQDRRSIEDDHTVLIGDLHRNSQLRQIHLANWKLLKGICSLPVSEGEDCIRQWYADCMYLIGAPQAYDHNTAQQWKALRGDLEGHLK